jgi:hypothetical protein
MGYTRLTMVSHRPCRSLSRAAMPTTLALLLGLANACSASPPPPLPQEPTASATSSALPTSSPVVAPSPAPSAAPPPPETAPAPPPAPPLESRFLPHDTSCHTDADCAVTERGLSERFFCCDPCDALPGNEAWVTRANAACKVYQKGASLHVCPPRDCGAPREAFCDAGQCAFTGCFPGATLSRAPSEEGDPVLRCVLPDGKLHGRATFFYPGTQKREMEGSYSRGEPCGSWTFWDPQGQERSERKKPCLP